MNAFDQKHYQDQRRRLSGIFAPAYASSGPKELIGQYAEAEIAGRNTWALFGSCVR